MSDLAKNFFFELESDIKARLDKDEKLTEFSVKLKYDEVTERDKDGITITKAKPNFEISYKKQLVNNEN